MWAVRAGLRFLVQLVVAVVITLVLAGLWYVTHSDSFRKSLLVGVHPLFTDLR